MSGRRVLWFAGLLMGGAAAAGPVDDGVQFLISSQSQSGALGEATSEQVEVTTAEVLGVWMRP
jgi:hypothetical protein